MEVRHVDSRGTTCTIKLRFGILEGLYFELVIGLYVIALNFMEVMQDLLTVQLEHQETKTQSLAMLYGHGTQFLMISGNEDDTDESLDSTSTMGSALPRPPILSGITLQTMLRYPAFYDQGQVEDQRAYELVYPQPWVDHNNFSYPMAVAFSVVIQLYPSF